jgi:SAM-dependent methyltransferase
MLRFNMLHKGRVAKAMWGNAKRQVRIFLGIKPRKRVWPPDGFETVLRRHTELAKLFLKEMPAGWDVRGKNVCEVGPSDCLSIASLLAGMGAAHVELVEPFPTPLNPVQARVLQSIQQNGFKLDTSILREEGEVTLDKTKVSYQKCFMEAIPIANAYDYIFSFYVLEHVEDLPGFYAACRKALKPGGQMFHCIDFSGHGELEDPVPPLDHQTYPDWVYDLMYPPYHRQTRFFLSDHTQATTQAGLAINEIRVTRRADPEYFDAVWPRLRKTAQLIPRDELAVLEAVVTSHKG